MKFFTVQKWSSLISSVCSQRFFLLTYLLFVITFMWQWEIRYWSSHFFICLIYGEAKTAVYTFRPWNPGFCFRNVPENVIKGTSIRNSACWSSFSFSSSLFLICVNLFKRNQLCSSFVLYITRLLFSCLLWCDDIFGIDTAKTEGEVKVARYWPSAIFSDHLEEKKKQRGNYMQLSWSNRLGQ